MNTIAIIISVIGTIILLLAAGATVYGVVAAYFDEDRRAYRKYRRHLAKQERGDMP